MVLYCLLKLCQTKTLIKMPMDQQKKIMVVRVTVNKHIFYFVQLSANATMHRHISVKVYIKDFVIMVKLYVSPMNVVAAVDTQCYNVLKSYKSHVRSFSAKSIFIYAFLYVHTSTKITFFFFLDCSVLFIKILKSYSDTNHTFY